MSSAGFSVFRSLKAENKMLVGLGSGREAISMLIQIFGRILFHVVTGGQAYLKAPTFPGSWPSPSSKPTTVGQDPVIL